MKILIVDDHPAIAICLQRALERLGHKAVLAHGPSDALRIVTADFDAVISDVQMPEMSGAELAVAIQRRHPGLRVAFYTASWDQEEIVANATRIGLVMPKPWKRSELTDLLEVLGKAA